MALNFQSGLFGVADDEGRRPSDQKYVSIPAAAWTTEYPAIDSVYHGIASLTFLVLGGATTRCMAPVNLPENATITAAVVTGNLALSGRTWSLGRQGNEGAGGFVTVATGSCNSWAVPTQSYSDGDNLKHNYMFWIDLINNGDIVWEGIIQYTV